MKTIPQFNLDESENIGAAFDEAGVEYERHGIITSVSRYGGGTAFVFCVEDEQFSSAIAVCRYPSIHAIYCKTIRSCSFWESWRKPGSCPDGDEIK